MKLNIGHGLQIAAVLQLGALAGSAQSYTYSGSETVINLIPGYYNITAYGAQGGTGSIPYNTAGGLGAEMSGDFYFSANTTLTLLVGGVGNGSGGGAGGGGGSYVVNGSTPLVIAGGGGGGAVSGGALAGGNGLTGSSGGSGGGGGGIGGSGGNGGGGGGLAGGGGGGGYSGNGSGDFGGGSFLSGGSGAYNSRGGSGGYGGGGGGDGGGGGGGGYSGGGGGAWGGFNAFAGGGGGSYIDPSTIAIITEVSGRASPDGSPNGEIIITEVRGPIITCPMPLTLECTNASAVATVQISVVDTIGLPLEVIWTVDGTVSQTNHIPSGGNITESNVTFTANFTEGEHTVVVSASDNQTAPVSCSTAVTVSDTVPPTVLAISATPDLLWPPNQQMVPVKVAVTAVDNCDPSPVAHITHVTSNEPQNTFAPDWEITGPLTVNLRAKRFGSKRGRIYTIVVECDDSSGNLAYASVDVAVPHDQRRYLTSRGTE